MRLHKRSQIIRNFCLFLLCSVFFVHVVKSLELGKSALNYLEIRDTAMDNWWILACLFPALYTVFWAKKSSKYVLVIYFCVVFYSSLIPLFTKFDKTIFILNFIFITLYFLFYFFWRVEISDSIYCPGFSPYNIEKDSDFGLKANVVDLKNYEFKGHITNWDPSGCFIYLDHPIKACRGRVAVNIKFEGKDFNQKGRVISSFKYGIGVQFELGKKPSKRYGWPEFFDILSDRGYYPIGGA